MVSNQAAILAAAGATIDHTGNLAPKPDVFPDYPAPIVRNGAEGRELVLARWGMPSPAFALKGRKTDPGVTNIRNTGSPHWRRWLGPEHRCLVPLTAFSENEHRPDGSKPPVWFALEGILRLAALHGFDGPLSDAARAIPSRISPFGSALATDGLVGIYLLLVLAVSIWMQARIAMPGRRWSWPSADRSPAARERTSSTEPNCAARIA